MGAFAQEALRVAEYGLSVIPVMGKKPCVTFGGKNKFGSTTIRKFAQQFPGADLAIRAEQSGVSGLVVVDVDDPSLAPLVRTVFPPTPIETQTQRGVHLYYRRPPGSVMHNVDLRSIDLEVEIKCNGIVVIAPSLHPKSGIRYEMIGDWSMLSDLPVFDESWIQELREHGSTGNPVASASRVKQPVQIAPLKQPAPPNGVNKRSRMAGPVNEGERANTLNDRLASVVFQCGTKELLSDLARAENSQFTPPLPDKQVKEIAWRVWEDRETGKLVDQRGAASQVNIPWAIVNKFSQYRTDGSHAALLFAWLVHTHRGKAREDRFFVVCDRAMAETEIIPGWPRSFYERARRVLIKTGAITCVSGGQFVPPERRNTPQLFKFGW